LSNFGNDLNPRKFNLINLIFCFPDRSSIKPKTFDPQWNETFIHEVENANTLGITVFHKAPIDDVFNANCTIPFEDLVLRNQQDQTDFWVIY
jgi:novel protein kinase C epsilon type